MPKASVKRLIECKKEQLIELVLDIKKYPEFVPFCLDSHVYEKNKEGNLTLIIADLTIGKGSFKDTYKSDVKFDCLLYFSHKHVNPNKKGQTLGIFQYQEPNQQVDLFYIQLIS